MAANTRSKYRQIAEEEENDTDPDYEDVSSESEEGISDQTVSDNDIVDVIDDEGTDININERVSPKKRNPAIRTRPKTSWIWNFFKETEDKAKVICQIEGCRKIFVWCGSPSSMKTHLSGIHHITKGIAASYLEALQKGDQQLIDNIIEEEISKLHTHPKQESLIKNMVGFIVGIVQPLSIVEDKDFIKMINGFDSYYKIPYSKTFKDQISSTYEAGLDILRD